MLFTQKWFVKSKSKLWFVVLCCENVEKKLALIKQKHKVQILWNKNKNLKCGILMCTSKKKRKLRKTQNKLIIKKLIVCVCVCKIKKNKWTKIEMIFCAAKAVL